MQNSVVSKVTRQNVYDALPALERMGERDLRAEQVHRLVMTISSVKAEIVVMDKVQLTVSEKYVALDENGHKIPQGNGFKLEDAGGFADEWNEYLQTNTEIEVWPLRSTDFNDKAQHKGNILVGMMAVGAYVIVEDEKKEDEGE